MPLLFDESLEIDPATTLTVTRKTAAAPTTLEIGPVPLAVAGREIDIDEFDRLLDLAVEIQGQLDDAGRTSAKFFLTNVGAPVAVWGLIVTAAAPPSGFATIGLATLLALFAVLALSSLVSRNRVMSLQERSLEEVLDVAREVERAIASREQIRPMTRARLRIRLSQFRLSGRKGSPVLRYILRGSL